MTSIARFHLRTAPLYAVVAFAMGIAMAASQDFRLVSAHSHLLMLGWVTTFLAGLFLAVCPSPAAERLPFWHLVTSHSGLVLLVIGVAAVRFGAPAAEALAAAGSLLTLVGMLMFAGMVFAATREAARRPIALH